MNPEEIAIIKQGKVYRIAAPSGTKIFNGDREANVDFDIVYTDGEMLLAKHVLDLAVRGEKGFRLTRFEVLPAD